MKKIIWVSIVLAVTFLFSSTLCASECNSRQSKGGRGEGSQVKERLAKELNLTAQQQKKMEASRQAYRQEMKTLRQGIREKEDKLQEALASPAITRAALNSIANEIKGLQGQLIDKRIDSIFAVEQILTPEQFAKFQQLTRDWQQKRNGRHQKQQGL